ncbi:MAG: hypothetical protein ACYCTB_10560 [bacterium]
MLYKNVNKGFYSNTALVKHPDKKNNKTHGIFLKTGKLNIDVLNPPYPALPDKFKDISITMAKYNT